MKRYFFLSLSVLIILAGLAVFLCMPARGIQPARAAARLPDTVIVVNTLEDELNSDGDCSLREAVEAANNNHAVDACPAGGTGTDKITFNVAGTITVTSQLSVTAGGPLVIDGGGGITTSGGGTTRVWYVGTTGSNLTLQNLTVAHGQSNEGGGLYNQGTVTLLYSTFSGNQVEGDASKGGGVYNYGTLHITDSTFTNNRAWVYLISGRSYIFYGGGVYNQGYLSISNSTFANNQVSYLCGGVGCLVSSKAYGGGGISNSGSLSVINSTFSGNSASGGDGGNYGGGIYNTGSASLVNTIVANSPSGEDCYGTITDNGHNLDSDGTCNLDPGKGSLPDTDPMLGPLQDNGGPTWTQALVEGSLAIDAGDNAQCPSTDQRGYYRPIDGDGDGIKVCDIGSFEYGSVGPRGIHLVPIQQHRDGIPDATITYHIDLYNFTETTDSYNLTLGSHAWQTALSTVTLGPVPPEGSQSFTATVSIPPEADWYQADSVVIKATSQTRPTIFTTSAQVTTRAYAPPQIGISPPTLESTQASGQIVTRTLMINNGNGVTLTYNLLPGGFVDDFNTDSHMWEYTYDSYRNPGAGYVVLTPLAGNKVGIVWLKSQISRPFIVEFRYKVGGGSPSGEGFVFMFYKNRDYIPGSSGECLGFGDSNNNCTAGGYGVEFDAESNEYGDPHYHHIALIKDTVWNHLAAVDDPRVEDGQWHQVQITVNKNDLAVSLDGGLVLTWQGEFDHAYSGFGFSAATSRRTNWHIIDDFQLKPQSSIDQIDWLTANPLSGTVPSNSSIPIQVALDSTGLDLGVYTTTLNVMSNDPLNRIVTMPTIMNVAIPVTPTAVTISGPEAGWVHASQAFTAVTEPISTSLPVTYTWQATGQDTVIHTSGITDTVAFAWQSPGPQTITVTAANGLGSVMDTQSITLTIPPYSSYLPTLLREQPAGSPASGAKAGALGFLGVVFSSGLGMVVWLRRKVDRKDRVRGLEVQPQSAQPPVEADG